MIWSDEQDAFIKRCWEDGLSAKLTSVKLNDEFGTAQSRNSIIGRWHRMGCSGRPSKWHPKQRFKTSSSKASAGRGELGATTRAVQAARKTALAPARVAPPIVKVVVPQQPRPVIPALCPDEPPLPVRGVALLDLKEKMCKFPIGDPQEHGFHFCGAPRAAGLPYCEKHVRVCLQPVQRRSKPARPVRLSNELKVLELEAETL